MDAKSFVDIAQFAAAVGAGALVLLGAQRAKKKFDGNGTGTGTEAKRLPTGQRLVTYDELRQRCADQHGLVNADFRAALAAQISALRGDMQAGFGAVNIKFENLSGRMDNFDRIGKIVDDILSDIKRGGRER